MMFPTSRRKMVKAVSFEPVGMAKITAKSNMSVSINDIELCGEEPLRLVQTLIDAYMWATLAHSQDKWEG
jgi:hypothetical protein